MIKLINFFLKFTGFQIKTFLDYNFDHISGAHFVYKYYKTIALYKNEDDYYSLITITKGTVTLPIEE